MKRVLRTIKLTYTYYKNGINFWKRFPEWSMKPPWVIIPIQWHNAKLFQEKESFELSSEYRQEYDNEIL